MYKRQALDKLTVFNLLPYEREGMIRGKIITKMKQFVLERPDGTRLNYEITDRRIVDAGLIDRQIVHYGNYEPFVEYTLEFCDRIPAMGFLAYLVKAEEACVDEAVESAARFGREPGGENGLGSDWQDENGQGGNHSGENFLENEYLSVAIEPNGSLTVFDKQKGQSYRDVLLLEDGSDDGDGYDYSPMADDWVPVSYTHLDVYKRQTRRCLSWTRS